MIQIPAEMMNSNDDSSIEVELTVQVMRYGDSTFDIGRVSFQLGSEGHEGSIDVVSRPSMWITQCKVLEPTGATKPKPDTVEKRAAALDGLSQEEEALALMELKSSEERDAVLKAKVCGYLSPTLLFDVATRKAGMPVPSRKPRHTHATFLHGLQADNLTLHPIHIDNISTSVEIYGHKRLSRLSLDKQLVNLNGMLRKDQKKIAFDDLSAENAKKLIAQLESADARHADMKSADAFTGESIHFDLQANHPHISTWQCELHNRVLKGKLSKPCRITFPPRLRNRLNIPEGSKWLSFMYPSEETSEIPNTMQKPHNEQADRLVQVIATAGAFAYFSEQDISQGLDKFDLKLDAVASCGCPDAADCYTPAVEFNFEQWAPFASITGLGDDVSDPCLLPGVYAICMPACR